MKRAFFVSIIVSIILISILFYFSVTEKKLEDSITGQSLSYVKLLSTEKCDGANCYNINVVCEGIKGRRVIVREINRLGSVGTIILQSGGRGVEFYVNGDNSKKIASELGKNNYQIFDVKWEGDLGWQENAEGRGMIEPTCGFTEIVKWIVDNKANNPELVCGAGNSFGSYQIATSLSNYNLEPIWDMVILSGGPPADLNIACFGSDDPELNKAKAPVSHNARGTIDLQIGLGEPYCENQIMTQEAQERLAEQSLIYEGRDYNFPQTKVNFVQANDPTNLDHQAEFYYDIIESEKDWHFIQIEAHDIPETQEGSEIITNLFLNECV